MKMYEEEIQVRKSRQSVPDCLVDHTLILFHTFIIQEWYTEYSRESLPEQDQSLQLHPEDSVSDPSSFLEPQLDSQTEPHSIN